MDKNVPNVLKWIAITIYMCDANVNNFDVCNCFDKAFGWPVIISRHQFFTCWHWNLKLLKLGIHVYTFLLLLSFKAHKEIK